METITINRILVPIDLDQPSPDIMNLVIAMSQRHKAEIRLLYVLSPEYYTFAAIDSLAVSMPHEEVLEAETQRLHQWADKMLSDHSVAYSAECRIGPTVDRIAESATEFRADLIIMGTHGSTGLLQYVMGSEAYHVINRAPCPVLTVPEQANVREFREILFPIRPVPGNMAKYEFTRTIARKNNAHLTILGLANNLEADAGKAININMALLSKHILDDALEADSLLSHTNSAVHTVLQQAEEQNADLIIITADHASNIRHLFVGPFFKQIISQAKRPVLCIKPQKSTPMRAHPAKGKSIPLFPMLNQSGFPLAS
ncbi:universal stress protein [Spirosoma sp. SC4-14]|uniref:universal stress protein n=1 Tax=Spirosoma sp. SC4-14 TaxID=3128900 RepID=UPI0030CE320D